MKKKKILSLALVVTMLFGIVSLLPENAFSSQAEITANAETSGDWEYYYNKDSNTIAITRYNGNSKTIKIPSKINNIPVTALYSSDGFMDSEISYYNLVSHTADPNSFCTVIIPDSIENIDAYFFWSVKDVNNIVVDNNNKYFASYDGMLFTKDMKVLLDCPEGKQGKAVIPNGTIYIGSVGTYMSEYGLKEKDLTDGHYYNSHPLAPFEDCNGITEISLPNSVEMIDARNLLLCVNLEKLNIPLKAKITDTCHLLSDKDYGMFHFMRNYNLKTIDVSSENSYYSVSGRFIYNKNKTDLIACLYGPSSIRVPDGTKRICENSFDACENAFELSLPDSVTQIDESAFFYNEGLEVINIPHNVSRINSCTFLGCTNLYSVSIENGVREICSSAFSGCTDLETVSLPNSVTSISDSAFYDCSSLYNISIPNSVKSIGSYAFYNCASLKKISIPNSVESIGDEALGYYYDRNDRMKKKISGFAIYGNKGSAAEMYSKSNGFDFIPVLETRLAGAGRYATAVEISKAGFPGGSKTVVLAYGLNYADALAGVSLANAMNAPILLTGQKSLPQETLDEIKRLKVTDVVILGGTGAVGAEVEKALIDNKLNVERIAGTSRFETAIKIAEKMQTLNNDNAPDDIFFVFYNGFADALSVSTVAAAKGAPVIYLQTNGELDEATAAYLAKIKGKVKNAYVIGGTGVISDNMMKKAGDALGLTPTRVFGADRFATCVAVNEKFANVLNGNSVCVATGMDFPDALAGGVFAAINKAPLFLVNGKENPLKLSDSQKSYLGTKAPQKLYVFGGTGAVSDNHVHTVAKTIA